MTLHDYLFTLLLAMAPVSELRGAIPFGLAHDIPQALLYPSCILANLLPVPFVILFLRRILAWMQRKGGRLAAAAGWLEEPNLPASSVRNFWGSIFSSPFPCPAQAHGRARWLRRCLEGGFPTPCSPSGPAS